MTADHHRVRDYVVREMPQIGKPVSPKRIAQDLNMDLEQVDHLLDDPEKPLTFLSRDLNGAVIWAYPITAEPIPHRVTFSTGETIYAA